jgi:hypothetical protein
MPNQVMCRVGQDRVYTPYMTVYLVISRPKIPYIQRIYMVLANPSRVLSASHTSRLRLPSNKPDHTRDALHLASTTKWCVRVCACVCVCARTFPQKGTLRHTYA